MPPIPYRLQETINVLLLQLPYLVASKIFLLALRQVCRKDPGYSTIDSIHGTILTSCSGQEICTLSRERAYY